MVVPAESSAQDLQNEHCTVFRVCATTTGHIAAQSSLNEKHDMPESVHPRNHSDYTLGRIGRHNVVSTFLSDGT